MGHLLLEHLKGWPLEGVLQIFFFFFENALSGSIHSTYQLASLQTDQNPPLGQPNLHPEASISIGHFDGDFVSILFWSVSPCIPWVHWSGLYGVTWCGQGPELRAH